MDFPIFLQSGFQPNQKTDKQGIYLDWWRELEPKNWVVLIYTNCLNRLIKKSDELFSLFTYIISISPNLVNQDTLTIFGKTNLFVSHIVLSYLGFNLGKETFSLSPLFYNYYTKLLHHQRDKHSY